MFNLKQWNFCSLEIKTDLNLLLECLKYQMDNPSSQKEALVTIHSICEHNSKTWPWIFICDSSSLVLWYMQNA